MIRSFVLVAFVGCLLFVTGCGSSVKIVPVEGIVKINGKPASNLQVTFMPDTLKGSQGPTSYGTTDAEGKFTLMTQDGKPGAAVGKHIVTLVDNEEDRPPQGKPAKVPASRVDPKHLIPTTSGIHVEVKEGGGPIEINASGPKI